MDFFSGKNPDLIGPTMRMTLNDIMNKPKINNSTISEKITDAVSNFYNDYICENLFIIFIIILIIVCLGYRYYDKKSKNINKNKNKENFMPEKCEKSKGDNVDLIEQIKNYNFEYDDLPRSYSPPAGTMYMNPLEGINDQTHKTERVYPPDTLPININDKKVFARNLYGTPIGDEQLNVPDYDYNNVYKSKSRSYYSGAYNTYNNAQDTTIENPYGWSNKFNTTSGNFVGPMTNQNLQSVIDYQTILDNTEANLIDGANGQNTSKYLPEFEKPYEE